MHRLLGKLTMIIIVLFITAFVAGMLMPIIESQESSALIRTPFDGVWWAFSTLSSVGYGDVYPVTDAGRILGLLLILFGSTLYFALTSLIAVALLLRETKKDHKEIIHKLKELEEKLNQTSKEKTK